MGAVSPISGPSSFWGFPRYFSDASPKGLCGATGGVVRRHQVAGLIFASRRDLEWLEWRFFVRIHGKYGTTFGDSLVN